MNLRFAGLCLVVLLGCGSSEDSSSPANGGSGATGGGGGAGAAGAPRGGAAGSGGQPKAGSAGASAGGAAGAAAGGFPAAGGTAGAGGSAAGAGGSAAGAGGAAGAAGAGAAGAAGAAGQNAAGSAGVGGGGEAGAGGGGAGAGGVTVEGRQIRVGGVPFHIKGICWNPVAKGKEHPAGLDFAGFVSIDGPLMAQAGINVVRTYEPLTDKGVLDQLHASGIKVINSVYPWGGSPVSEVTARVNASKDHPAVLMWSLGNEWNYNGLYVGLSHQDALARLNEAAALVKAADPTRPIATVYGELPSVETIGAMPLIDVWGLNVYRGITLGDLFDQWEARSGKPMFLGEYGADAFNAKIDAYDPASQAEAVEKLTLEIGAKAAAKGGVCSGGALFEWADEWWKAGAPGVQDKGGSAPGGGPFPDQTFNEEWWGIVDIDRAPRPAYEAYKKALLQGP